MEIPEYLLGDNSNYPDDIFIIHTSFPRFVINLRTDDVEWLEEFDKEDKKHLEEETVNYIREASEFYDAEVKKYENEA